MILSYLQTYFKLYNPKNESILAKNGGCSEKSQRWEKKLSCFVIKIGLIKTILKDVVDTSPNVGKHW